MSAPLDDAPRCWRCRAPIGRSGGRCPLCGAPAEGPQGAPPFDPALAGRASPQRVQPVDRPRQPGAARPARSGWMLGLLAVAVVAMAGLVVALLVLYRETKRITQGPVPSACARPVGSQARSAPLNLNGITIDTRGSIDPTDLLPAVKRRLAEPGRRLSLLDLEVRAARRGVVDLDAPGAGIVYRFLLSAQDPHALDPPPPEVLVLPLTLQPEEPVRAPAGSKDKTVIEPTCVWSAAWRAALAAGLPESEPFDAKFAPRTDTGTGTWIFTSSSAGGTQLEIDGQSCAIKTR